MTTVAMVGMIALAAICGATDELAEQLEVRDRIPPKYQCLASPLLARVMKETKNVHG